MPWRADNLPYYFETMNNHVPTLETCQKLKAAGFPQDIEHCWAYDFDINGDKTGEKDVYPIWELEHHEVQDYELCAAPLLTEILEQLPHKHQVAGQDSPLRFNMFKVYKGRPVSYQIGYGNVRPFAIHSGHSNSAEAAALLWLNLNTA